MLGQVVGCPEELVADLALESLLGLVCEHVLVQTPLPPPLKLLAADLTGEEGGPVGQLFVDLVIVLMSLPAEFTFKFPVASVAFKRHFSRMYLSLVAPGLDLLLESLATVGTGEPHVMTRPLLVLAETFTIREFFPTNPAVSFVFDSRVDYTFLLRIVLLFWLFLLHIGIVLHLSLHDVIRLIPALISILDDNILIVNYNLVWAVNSLYSTFMIDGRNIVTANEKTRGIFGLKAMKFLLKAIFQGWSTN